MITGLEGETPHINLDLPEQTQEELDDFVKGYLEVEAFHSTTENDSMSEELISKGAAHLGAGLTAAGLRTAALFTGLQGFDNLRTRIQLSETPLTGTQAIINACKKHQSTQKALADILWTGIIPNAQAKFTREVSRNAVISLIDDTFSNLPKEHIAAIQTITMIALDTTFIPFDQAKIRLNKGDTRPVFSPMLDSAISGDYRGLRHVIESAYEGAFPTILRQSATWAGRFFSKEPTEMLLKNEEERKLTTNEKLVSSLMVGAVSGMLSVPFGVIKTRMQAGNAMSTFETAMDTFQKEGIKGFGKGGLYKFLITAIPGVIINLVRTIDTDEIVQTLGLDRFSPEQLYNASHKLHTDIMQSKHPETSTREASNDFQSTVENERSDGRSH